MLSRLFGLSCDNLVEVEVVLSSGDIIRAKDENDYWDLIAGIRGIGNCELGVCTEFVFEIHEITMCIGGSLNQFCPTSASLSIYLTSWSRWVESAPSHIQSILYIPCGSFFISAIGTLINPPLLNLSDESLLKDLREFLELSGSWHMQGANTMKRRDYHYDIQKLASTSGFKNNSITTGICLKDMSPNVIKTLVNFTRTDYPNSSCSIKIINLSEKVRVGHKDRPSCVKYRSNRYWVLIESVHSSEEDLEFGKHWIMRFKQEVLKFCKAPSPSHPFFDGVTSREQLQMLTKEQEIDEFLKEAVQKYDSIKLFSCD